MKEKPQKIHPALTHRTCKNCRILWESGILARGLGGNRENGFWVKFLAFPGAGNKNQHSTRLNAWFSAHTSSPDDQRVYNESLCHYLIVLPVSTQYIPEVQNRYDTVLQTCARTFLKSRVYLANIQNTKITCLERTYKVRKNLWYLNKVRP